MITKTIKQAGLTAFAVAALSIAASMAGPSNASAAGLSVVAPITNATSDVSELVTKVRSGNRSRRAGRANRRGSRNRGGRRFGRGNCKAAWCGGGRGRGRGRSWVRFEYGGGYGCFYKRKRVWSRYYGEYIIKRVRRCY